MTVNQHLSMHLYNESFCNINPGALVNVYGQLDYVELIILTVNGRTQCISLHPVHLGIHDIIILWIIILGLFCKMTYIELNNKTIYSP